MVGVEQMGMPMDNIKVATEQNVASIKQMAAAANSLYDLRQKLQQQAELYKT